MGRMTLHWSPKSPYVRKVMMVAHEVGVADRIRLVRSVAAMRTINPAIMVDNPLGKIPTMVLEDGTSLFNSVVICEYLTALGQGGLFPEGARRWPALTQHALADGLLDLLILWRNERDKPADRQTPEWLDAFGQKALATLDRLDEGAVVLMAEDFTIGHVAIGCALGYLDFRFEDLAWRHGRPALAGWFETFCARPSAKATEVSDG